VQAQHLVLVPRNKDVEQRGEKLLARVGQPIARSRLRQMRAAGWT
jgi:hypothetical protein